MLSPKSSAIFFGIVSAVVLVINWLGTSKICGGTLHGNCMSILFGLALVLVPFIPAFLFALLLLVTRTPLYIAWFRFARWWLPLSMVGILLAPQYDRDWMFPIEKGTVALVTSVIFIAVSLIIIGTKYFSKK